MKKIFFAFLGLLLITPLLLPAQTGTINGTITDKQTGDPLPGTNVFVTGTKLGAATDMNGFYEIKNVPEGTYTLKISMIGYEEILKKNVNVKANTITTMNFKLEPSKLEGEMITIVEEKPKTQMDMSSSMMVKGALAPPAPGEGYIDFNTEEYSKINESGFLEVLQHPLSTFAADVDAASYSNARRFIMRDQLPYKDAVRSEEFINYFNYDYKIPEDEHPLSINMEYSECPWNEKCQLIHIGLQGKKLSKADQKPSNLVFLIDVSGSMNDPKKLPLLQKSFNLMVDQLKAEDHVALVVYAGNAGLVLPSTPGSEKEVIKDAINRLSAGGSTAGGAGIQLAYKIAKQNLIPGGNNRVILATDGDFNIGISSTAELTRFIEEKRDDGIFLTVLGFGMGNYKDYRLQELADRGNGNHAYIDNILEAKKVLVNDLTATLFTIAKDVKIQVEFNPVKIKSYRLIGYENRELQDEDFVDDTKDAGEIGAGHTVTALYEVVPADDQNTKTYDLKYTERTIKKDAEKSDEILTVRIRYKEPDGKTSTEFSSVLKGKPAKLAATSDNFRFSAAVAEFAMVLRDSEFKGTADINSVKKLAASSLGQDPFGYRKEFMDLTERAALLMK
ncbi:von Willebrand factor type A domain-containing protein [candidate division KSB1 bacterium]|nr:von Willebrand factor type A domain-containing protein [candidate division KSB1 bacterium]